MFAVPKETTYTPPDEVIAQVAKPQTFPSFLANGHDAEAWIRHYEWEGAGWLGIVSPTRLTAPLAPSSALAFRDEQLC